MTDSSVLGLVMVVIMQFLYYAILRNVIEYFNERGSNVYLASLDASKAFDRVNHFQLYMSLMKRRVPVAFLNIIIN